MTYPGKTNMIKDHKIVADEKYPMSEQGYTTGKLLVSTEYQILLDTWASKSFMSKSQLFKLHVTLFITQICFENPKNSSR